ncbi:MAG: DUF1697 domain-containing protein [Rubrivivax sp.]|jgi:uncharacterized protein (DUF1697 family)|nr:DUF1697 domain-containing protein [Rubrivivax sp.]
MSRHVAFLRAINVTGRYIAMDDLIAHFKDMGHMTAWSYLNSGNIVLEAEGVPTALQVRTLQQDLATRLGFDSTVFLRSMPELRRISARAQALREALLATPGCDMRAEVNVLMLAEPVPAIVPAALAELGTEIDRFEVDGRDVYWSCRRPQNESKFSGASLERRFKVRTTVRRQSMLSGLMQALDSR